jgi:hypothetical protein
MRLHHHRQQRARFLAPGLGLLASCLLAITLPTMPTVGEQRQSRKPARPWIGIDNEGPVTRVPYLVTTGDGQHRHAHHPDPQLLPWRSVIRLDLIVPIRPGPWIPPAPRRR